MSGKPKLYAVKPPPLPRSAAAPPLLDATDALASEDTGARRRDKFRVGRYEVNALLAHGGMAKVHLGRVLGAAGFSRVVAIKRLLPQFAEDPEFEAMLVEEAQVAARIRHPNVVPTLDVVASEGELLLVMEYVHGETLARLVTAARAEGGVPRGIALAIVCDALHGLHAAHEAKDRQGRALEVVHRDMSPQNVIVGVDGVARVIDFGIAKAATSVDTTRAGLVRGKAAYMAPEQLFSAALTRRADLYAMGVVLWELLTGERLFPGGSRPDLLKKAEGDIASPRQRVPSLPAELDRITMCALATNEADRYADAQQMAAELERTGLVAPRSEVAVWVERLAAQALAKRSKLVEAVEATARSVPPPAPAPVSSHESATGALNPIVAPIPAPGAVPASAFARHRAKLAGAAVALLAFAVLGVSLTRHTPAPEPSKTAIPPEIAAPAPTGVTAAPQAKATTPVPDDQVPEKAATSTPEAARTPAPPPDAALAKPSAATKTSTKTKARSKNCNPPYTVDAKGRRRYKAECF
ncbi:MAG TPA: serine/threonine-protein kinase [Polyangiaceae bacterium]